MDQAAVETEMLSTPELRRDASTRVMASSEVPFYDTSAGRIGLGIASLGIVASFWPLIHRLPELWFGDETYYAHGSVVPICSALIIWNRSESLKKIPIRGSWIGLPLLATILYLTWFAWPAGMWSLASLLFVGAVLASLVLVAGFRIAAAISPAILYLLFGLPVFGKFIDKYTQPLQDLSASSAFQLLRLTGLHPYRGDATSIYLEHYTLDVGVPCSGLKLLLAVAAIVTFFALIAHLKWSRNILLLASAIPLSLLINGIRIAMIGIVGNFFGSEAGHKFHDYSGYISLVLCFFILMKLTKMLGWK